MFKPTDQPPPGNGDLRPAQSIVSAGTGASREFHNFVADVEDLITSSTPLTGEDLARAKEKLRQQVSAAKASIETMRHDVTAQARQTAAATDQYVHANPWKSAGVGAAVGLLVGFLLARRN